MRFGSQSGKSRHVAEFARELSFQRVEQTEMPGLDDIGDLAGQILADPRQLRQIAPDFSKVPAAFGRPSMTRAARR